MGERDGRGRNGTGYGRLEEKVKYKTFRELFENELLPYMLAIGVTEDEFWHLTLRQMKIRQKAHEIRMKMQDEQAWAFCGNYVFSAVSTAVDHCMNGRKAKSKYIEKPMLENFGLTEEEIKQKKLNEFIEYRKRAAEAWKRKKSAESEGKQ